MSEKISSRVLVKRNRSRNQTSISLVSTTKFPSNQTKKKKKKEWFNDFSNSNLESLWKLWKIIRIFRCWFLRNSWRDGEEGWGRGGGAVSAELIVGALILSWHGGDPLIGGSRIVGRKDTLDREERSGHRSGQRIIGHEICIGKSREPLKSSALKGGFI